MYVNVGFKGKICERGDEPHSTTDTALEKKRSESLACCSLSGWYEGLRRWVGGVEDLAVEGTRRGETRVSHGARAWERRPCISRLHGYYSVLRTLHNSNTSSARTSARAAR